MKQIKLDFVWRPESDPLSGFKLVGQGQNSTSFEYGHAPYYIKENEACSNMIAKLN